MERCRPGWGGPLPRLACALLLAGGTAARAEAGKLGALEWEETITASLEYNSNINTSETAPVADWIVAVRLGINGKWEWARDEVLTFGLGFGYKRYIGNSGFQIENAAIRWMPDTTIDFDFRVSDNLTFRISDAITFSENAADITLRGEDGELETSLFSFERIMNRFAVEGVWTLSRRNQITGSVWRADTWPLQSRFNRYRRVRQGVDGAWTHAFNRDLRVGLGGSVFETRYPRGGNNDSDGYYWGPFIDYSLSENLSVNGYVNFTRIGFERDRADPLVEDQFDFSGIQWGVGLEHALNRRTSYTLEYAHSTDYGFISNFRELDTLSLAVSYQATRTVQSFLSASYEWGLDSGGIAPDDWEKFYITAGFAKPLWKQFELSGRVRWVEKWSQRVNRSYDQFSVYIGLVYHFSDK